MGKKQHIGSHSRRSYPIKHGLPKEENEKYRSNVVIKDGELVKENGKVKVVRSKMKKGLKFIKRFLNKKRRGFLKQENRNEIN